MTCFTREEIWGHLGGLVLVVVPFIVVCLVAFGWALGEITRALRERPRRGRRVRRRRAPLAVLAERAHNPDIDGVFAPPDPDKETP